MALFRKIGKLFSTLGFTINRTLRTAPLLLMIIVLVFFGEHTFVQDGNFIGGIDISNYSFWNALYTKSQLLSGKLPLWNPYNYSGQPFLANPQTFVFYPTTVLFVMLPLPWAFNLNALLHVYLAGLGTYYFLIQISGSKYGALVGGLIYCLSGYFMDTLAAGHLSKLHTAALLPWVFYFTEKGFKKQAWHYFAIAGSIIGLQILGGGTQNSLYSALFITVYFFVRSLNNRTKHFMLFKKPSQFFGKTALPFDKLSLPPLGKQGLFFFLIPLFAFGVGAIQILPSAEFLTLSDRADNSFSFATYYAFPPKNFFSFLVSKPPIPKFSHNWEFEGYFGIFAFSLAIIGALFGKHRRQSLCFVIMTGIAITVMLGDKTPLYQFYYTWIPGISSFRIPARCILLVVFCMACLAGLGTTHLIKFPLKRRVFFISTGWTTLLLTGLLLAAARLNLAYKTAEMQLAIGLIIATVCVLIAAKFVPYSKIIFALILVIVFADAYINNADSIPTVNQKKLSRPLQYENKLNRKKGLYRVSIRRNAARAMGFAYQNINGYCPICLKSYYQFVHQMTNTPIPQKKRHQLGKKVFKKNNAKKLSLLNIRYDYPTKGTHKKLKRTRDVMPRAWLASTALIMPKLENQILKMKTKQFDPEKEVLLQNEPPHPPALLKPLRPKDIGKKDKIKIKQYSASKIKLWVRSNQHNYLVLSELFYPGWKAFVNGRETPIFKADYLLRAIKIGKGRGNITFIYRPFSVIMGSIISSIALLALVLVLIHRQLIMSTNPTVAGHPKTRF